MDTNAGWGRALLATQGRAERSQSRETWWGGGEGEHKGTETEGKGKGIGKGREKGWGGGGGGGGGMVVVNKQAAAKKYK